MLLIAGGNPYAAIGEQLANPSLREKLSVDGQQRLATILSVLTTKIAERERYDLRTWIESTWLLLGGPACLHEYADMDDAHAFFKLLEEFSQHNPILNLDKLKEKINQLFASTQHDDAKLQIMTIHTAKGLEFDTVILPHLERKMPSDEKSLLSWMERPLANDQMALLLAPIHAIGNDKDITYEYIHRQQRIKSDYETDRLFYVAATRAKKRLHLFFSARQKENQEFRIESGSFLEKIWPFVKLKTQEIIFSHHVVANSPTPQNEIQRHIKRIHVDWVNPIQEISINSVASHQKQSGFQLANHKPQLIGVVSHRVLQHITTMGMDWWKKQSEKNQLNYLRRQLLQQGLIASELEEATVTTRHIIDNAINDTRGKWILQPHRDAKSEFALTAVIAGKPETLVIDRTFIDETGTRWIIDYKTTTLSHHDLDVFLEKEQKKYLQKMHKYYQAIQLIDHHPIRLGLYFPALPAWREY